jgi:CsoR family transcriptional regulator, copper-sensing transcriptional repressor
MVVRGYTLEKDAYLTRLRKIEGQVRGLQRMIDDDVYCIDILNQVSSVEGALRSVALGLVDQHLRLCVVAAVASGDEAEANRKLAEATQAIERLVRT